MTSIRSSNQPAPKPLLSCSMYILLKSPAKQWQHVYYYILYFLLVHTCSYLIQSGVLLAALDECVAAPLPRLRTYWITRPCIVKTTSYILDCRERTRGEHAQICRCTCHLLISNKSWVLMKCGMDDVWLTGDTCQFLVSNTNMTDDVGIRLIDRCHILISLQ